MQTKKHSFYETLINFACDNAINGFLVILATFVFNVEIATSLSIVLIGQALNLIVSYIRRRLCSKYLN